MIAEGAVVSISRHISKNIYYKIVMKWKALLAYEKPNVHASFHTCSIKSLFTRWDLKWFCLYNPTTQSLHILHQITLWTINWSVSDVTWLALTFFLWNVIGPSRTVYAMHWRWVWFLVSIRSQVWLKFFLLQIIPAYINPCVQPNFVVYMHSPPHQHTYSIQTQNHVGQPSFIRLSILNLWPILSFMSLLCLQIS